MTTNDKATVMAKRTTFDGKSVAFWTDGAVTTGYFETYVRGCGVAREPREIAKNVEACWLLASEVCLYDASELPRAVAVARKAVRNRQAEALHYFRQAMAGKIMRTHCNAMGSVAAVTFAERASK